MTLQLHIVSYRVAYLETFIGKLIQVVSPYCKFVKVVPLPTKSKLFTVLKSPFVNKKSREQLCLQTHRRLVVLEKVDSTIVVKFLKSISSKGIALKVTFKGG